MNFRFKTIFGCLILFLLTGVIAPFCLTWAERSPVKQLVIIDPAHGGAEKGVKLSGKVYEKDITLKIASQLQRDLQAGKDIVVRLTRTTDRDMSVAERAKFVSASGARMFISLHVNAGFGKDASGYEVYFPGFSAAVGKNATPDIIKDMASNKYLNESVALSQNIRQSLQSVFPGKDRQLREAPVLILEGLTLPAVMLEVGFATNKEDKKTLADEEGQRAIAKALSDGIRGFLHVN